MGDSDCMSITRDPKKADEFCFPVFTLITKGDRSLGCGYWLLTLASWPVLYVGISPLLLFPVAKGFEVGGLMDLVSPIWVDWLTAVLFGALLVTELAFLPETLYPRNHMLSIERPTTTQNGRRMVHSQTESIELELRRTTTLPFINLRPIPGMRHPKPWDSVVRFGLTFKFPVVVLTVAIFCFAWYWWLLSIITMIPAAYSQFTPSTQGLLFLGLLLGAWTAELFCSGRLSDWLVERLSQKQGAGGVRVAEMRLWLAYPAALLSASKFPPRSRRCY